MIAYIDMYILYLYILYIYLFVGIYTYIYIYIQMNLIKNIHVVTISFALPGIFRQQLILCQTLSIIHYICTYIYIDIYIYIYYIYIYVLYI